MADIRFDYSQTLSVPVQRVSMDDVREILAAHVEAGRARLAEEAAAITDVAVTHHAEMAYEGQIHQLKVEIDPEGSPADMAQAFQRAYAAEYQANLGDLPIHIVNLRTTVTGRRPRERRHLPDPAALGRPEPVRHRRVHFGEWIDTPVYAREGLQPGHAFAGPAIVEQGDTTTVIEPGLEMRVDAYGNLVGEAR